MFRRCAGCEGVDDGGDLSFCWGVSVGLLREGREEGIFEMLGLCLGDRVSLMALVGVWRGISNSCPPPLE